VQQGGPAGWGDGEAVRPVDRDQPFLLPPDLREWLPAGHLAWFVIDAAEALDVSRFAVRVTPRGSAAGRAAYDPRMLLALLACGYARGIRSSRRIERACTEDVAFRVICAQDVPDHATIARFRRAHFADRGAVADLFGQVLVLAARAGRGSLGQIAVDGTKMAASASREANRGEERLRELAGEILAEAEAADAAEDALLGDARGDELPGELADPVTRGQRIRAALADIEAERKAAPDARDARVKDHLDASAAGRGPGGPRPGRRPGWRGRRRRASAPRSRRRSMTGQPAMPRRGRPAARACPAPGPSPRASTTRSAGPRLRLRRQSSGPRHRPRKRRRPPGPARSATSPTRTRG
jgi:transposase